MVAAASHGYAIFSAKAVNVRMGAGSCGFRLASFSCVSGTYLTLSAEVRAILMRKDGEPMSDTPQTNDEIPDDAECALQAYWDRIGLDHATRVRLLADLNQKCAPGAWVGPFQIPETPNHEM